MMPKLGDWLELVERGVRTKALVIGHYMEKHLHLRHFPPEGAQERERIIFVYEGEEPPDDQPYCTYPPSVIMTPGNVTIS